MSDLKEIILFLRSKKRIIITTIYIFLILSFTITKFLLPKVYDTELGIIINMSESCNTKYGDCSLPITTNEQYAKLILSNDVIKKTIDDMDYEKENISISELQKRILYEASDKSNQNPNTFNIIISASTPKESLKLTKILYKNYLQFIDTMVNKQAAEYLHNVNSVETEKLQQSLIDNEKLLEGNKKLLNQIPKTINQKQAVGELEDIKINSLDYVVLEDIINTNYSKLELDILALEQNIIDIKLSLEINNTYLKELSQIKNKIKNSQKFYTDRPSEYSLTNAAINNIYALSEPVEPSSQTSPKLLLNLTVSAVCGAIFSIMYVLIKEYIK